MVAVTRPVPVSDALSRGSLGSRGWPSPSDSGPPVVETGSEWLAAGANGTDGSTCSKRPSYDACRVPCSIRERAAKHFRAAQLTASRQGERRGIAAGCVDAKMTANGSAKAWILQPADVEPLAEAAH